MPSGRKREDIVVGRVLVDAADAQKSLERDLSLERVKKKQKKPKARRMTIAALLESEEFAKLRSGGVGDGGFGEPIVEGKLFLAVHTSGEKANTVSGKVLYSICVAAGEKESWKKHVTEILPGHYARFWKHLVKWVVDVETAVLARKLHDSISTAPSLKETAKLLTNPNALDVSLFEDERVVKAAPKFHLMEFETPVVVLAKSQPHVLEETNILIVGKFIMFKKMAKAHWASVPGALRWLEVTFMNGAFTRSGWVLKAAAQTEETGTLEAFIRGLGCEVVTHKTNTGLLDHEIIGM